MMKYLLALSLLVFGLQACYNDKADQLYGVKTSTGCDTSSVTYSGTIKAIMDQNCSISGCHDATTQANGYNFSTYSGLATSIQLNRLLGAINQENGYFAMPQSGGKLASCDIDKITAWVHNGYPNN
jgi:hypothetical protein